MQKLLLEAFGPMVVAFLLLAVVLSGKRLLHRVRNRQSPEERQAARDSFRNRLVHPKHDEIEHALGAFLPERLLTLYRDHPTVLTEQLELRNPEGEPKDASEWIEAFLPLDLETQKLTAHALPESWGKGFCFATDGEGSFYCVPMNKVRQPDAPVFFAANDPPAVEQVADSLDQFLSWSRTLHGADAESSSGS